MKTPLLGAIALVIGSMLPASPAAQSEGPVVLDGVVQPFRVSNVGAPTDGVLSEVFFDRGDHVMAGELIATLSLEVEEANALLAKARTELKSELQTAIVRSDSAKKQLERREGLSVGIVTPEELEDARTKAHLEELAVLAAEEEHSVSLIEYNRALAILKRGQIKSPITGVVAERVLSPGELLSRSGQSYVLTIAQLDPLRIEVHAPVSLYSTLTVGESCQIKLHANIPGEHNARIVVIDRIVDTASDTFRVRLELPNPDGLIPAGLRCDVSLPQ